MFSCGSYTSTSLTAIEMRPRIRGRWERGNGWEEGRQTWHIFCLKFEGGGKGVCAFVVAVWIQ